MNRTNSLNSGRLAELIAAAKAKAAMMQAESASEATPRETTQHAGNEHTSPDAGNKPSPERSEGYLHQSASINANNETANAETPKQFQQTAGWQWNREQQAAIDLIASGKSCCIVGSAGTGKTTLVKEAIKLLAQNPSTMLITSSSETEVLQVGMPAIVACSFTKTAVANINRAIDGAVATATIHKLIEFKPQFYEVWNEETSQMQNKRIFEPTRNRHKPLPSALKTIIVEESGIVNIRLFDQLIAALPNPAEVQFIFLGDLFQLDPPYDPAILGYALNYLPVVELTQVYRQALESPILKFAIDIKNQQTWGGQHLESLNRTCSETGSSLTVKHWKHRLDSFKATSEAAKFIEKEWKAGRYEPSKCSIITPFGATLNSKDKEAAFGSFNLNKYIANFLGKNREAVVYEVIAGFNKHYLAVGDHVSVAKIRGEITKITRNGIYLGKISPQPPSKHLDRFGFNSEGANFNDLLEENDADTEREMDRLLSAASADNSEAIRNASHVITVELEDGSEVELRTSGEFSPATFDFSYAQTCYKAQGGEWESVYIFTHKSHAVSLCNEFFYTAATRARKHLTLICEPDHLLNPVKKQAIPGSNWQEKKEYFNSPKKLESIKPFENLCIWLAEMKQKFSNQ